MDHTPEASGPLSVTCFACFTESQVTTAAGAVSVPCPQCGQPIELGPPPAATEEPNPLADLSDPRQRVLDYVKEAYETEARQNELLGMFVNGVTGQTVKGVKRSLH